MKEPIPENVIKIRLEEGIFWNSRCIIFEENYKNCLPEIGISWIYRKRFFIYYYDPVQILEISLIQRNSGFFVIFAKFGSTKMSANQNLFYDFSPDSVFFSYKWHQKKKASFGFEAFLPHPLIWSYIELNAGKISDLLGVIHF